MKLEKRRSVMLALLTLVATCLAFPQVNTKAGPPEVRESQGFKPGQARTWFFWSFLPEGDQAEIREPPVVRLMRTLSYACGGSDVAARSEGGQEGPTLRRR